MVKYSNRKKCKNCGELDYPSKIIKVFYGETAYFCSLDCLSKWAIDISIDTGDNELIKELKQKLSGKQESKSKEQIEYENGEYDDNPLGLLGL